MGKAQSFNEYAMIQSAIIETRRKIEARNDSIERQRELLLAQEDTLKRGKLLEQIESEKKSIERDKKLLKSLEEKAEKTAMKGNLSEDDRHKAQNLADIGKKLENSKEAKPVSETETKESSEKNGERKTQTGYDKSRNNVNENKKTNADARDGKRTPEMENRKPKEKTSDAKRTSPEKFPLKNKRDLSLEIADARERLHIAEDHFKNSLNTQTHNAFVRTRKEE